MSKSKKGKGVPKLPMTIDRETVAEKYWPEDLFPVRVLKAWAVEQFAQEMDGDFIVTTLEDLRGSYDAWLEDRQEANTPLDLILWPVFNAATHDDDSDEEDSGEEDEDRGTPLSDLRRFANLLAADFPPVVEDERDDGEDSINLPFSDGPEDDTEEETGSPEAVTGFYSPSALRDLIATLQGDEAE